MRNRILKYEPLRSIALSWMFYVIWLIASSLTALAVDKLEVAKAIKADNVSLQDCKKWYTVYKGSYIYMKELDAVGSKDFGDVFDKIRVVRDKLAPEKGNVEFIKATDLIKFEELEFTPENKTDLAEELYQVCEGLKLAMESK